MLGTSSLPSRLLFPCLDEKSFKFWILLEISTLILVPFDALPGVLKVLPPSQLFSCWCKYVVVVVSANVQCGRPCASQQTTPVSVQSFPNSFNLSADGYLGGGVSDSDDGVDDVLAAGDVEVCRATSVTSLVTRDCSVDALLNLGDISGGDSGGANDAPDSGAEDDDGLPPECLLRYVWMVLLWVILLGLTLF